MSDCLKRLAMAFVIGLCFCGIAAAQTADIGCDPPPPPFDNFCLADGPHTVVVQGTDNNGDVKATSITVAVDHTPPTVTFGTTTGPGRKWQRTIGISVTDATALTRVLVLVNDVVVIDVAPGTPQYATSIVAPTRARLAVAATDSVGNTVTNTFVVPR